jgi:hypothetical protein
MEITDRRESVTIRSMRHPMAQYAPNDDGVLDTRAAGERALSDLERAIAARPDHAVIALDFSGVRAITVPFADASLGRLLTGRVAGFYEDQPIVLVDANEDVRETIALALRYRNLVALVLGSGGPPRLLGADEVLEKTMNAALELQDFSVIDLASRLNLTPQAANNRLRHLMRNGALERERVNPRSGGREFRYRVPDAA